MPHSQVARDLGVDPDTLRRWVRELTPYNASAHDSTPSTSVRAAELTRLRRENEQLRMERAILKKAIGIFSQVPQ